MNLKDALAELRRLEERVHAAQGSLLDPECTGSDRRRAKAYLRQCENERQAFLRSLNPRVSTTGEAGALAGAAQPKTSKALLDGIRRGDRSLRIPA